MTWSAFLLQGSIYLLILFATYWFLLRQTTFFQLNRWVLLGILAASCLLPLLPAPSLVKQISIELFPASTIPYVPEVAPGNAVVTLIPAAPTTSVAPVMDSTKGWTFNWLQMIWWIYLFGVIGLLCRFIYQLVRLTLLLISANWTKSDKHYLAFTDHPVPPFSFFRFILLNHSLYSPETVDRIICHEKVHSDQWHSFDILVAELFSILFWFHPLSWLLFRMIRLNLEFIADQEVLQQEEDPRAYQYSLLEVGTTGSPYRLINHFNHSILKNRVIMMNAKQSPESTRLRYLLLLPFVFILFSLFNIAYTQETVPKPDAQVESNENYKVTVVPRADARATQTVGTTTGIGTGTATGTGTVAAAPEAPVIAGGSNVASAASPAPTVSGVTVVSGSGSNVIAPSATTISGVASTGSGATSTPTIGTTVQPATGIATESDHITATVIPGPTGSRGENIYMVIRADLDKATLENFQKELGKKGVEMAIPKLEYNAEGLITYIEVKINAGNSFHANTFSSNNDGPIDKPVVFYRLVNGRNSYGLGTGITENTPLEIRKIIETKSLNGLIIGKFNME